MGGACEVSRLVGEGDRWEELAMFAFVRACVCKKKKFVFVV